MGVVIPRHKEDVLATIGACRQFGAPILSRGGGTSLAGQCCNFAVVMDMSKYLHGVLHLDAAGRRARVLPGTVLDVLRGAANQHDLTFGPDPSTHNHCTLGGMIGNNSCGVHSVMAGRTAENVHELEIATYDGLVMRVGPTPPDELEAIIRAGRPARRDLRADESLDRPRRAAGARALPQDPAPRVRLQPGRALARKRVPRRAGPGRQRGDAGDGSRGDVAPGAVAARANLAGARLPRHLHRRRPRADGAAGGPDRPRGDRRSADAGHAQKGAARPLSAVPAGRQGVPHGGVRRRHSGRSRRQGARRDRAAAGLAAAPDDEDLRRPRSGTEAVGGPQIGAGRDRADPGLTRHLGRVGRLRRSARAHGRLPARAAAADGGARLRRRLLRPLRPRLPAHPHQLRPDQRRGHRELPRRSSRRQPIWWCATAGRCRASTATASRAASC